MRGSRSEEVQKGRGGGRERGKPKGPLSKKRMGPSVGLSVAGLNLPGCINKSEGLIKGPEEIDQSAVGESPLTSVGPSVGHRSHA